MIGTLQVGSERAIVDEQVWAVLLAGGDGSRLQPLTRLITGEDRPKQFCPLYSGQTLLARTRSRLAGLISKDRTIYSVVKSHERFYADELAAVKPSRVVVQPANKGTTAAVVSSLLRIAGLAGDRIVAFFPTDHHYSREARFLASVRLAIGIVHRHPDSILLLGARAERAEVEYGWIEPGRRLEHSGVFSPRSVHRFWEKPSTHVAQALQAHGCLWNTFVMMGRVTTFLRMVDAVAPDILRLLERGRTSSKGIELAHDEKTYAAITSEDFSRNILSVSTGQLAVLPLGNVGWSDLGTPERATFAMTRSGLTPPWVASWHHEILETRSKVTVR